MAAACTDTLGRERRGVEGCTEPSPGSGTLDLNRAHIAYSAGVAILQRMFSTPFHAVRRVLEHIGEISPETAWARRFGSFGAGSLIGYPQATLLNEQAIHIGTDTLIGRQVTLSVGYGIGDTKISDRHLVIGDRCIIGARTTITAHEYVEIGDDVWFGQGIFISDASHGYQDPDMPIGRQFGTHHPVSIGAGSWIGHGAMIMPGTRIGRNVVIGAGSVVRGTIPDHSVAVGSPATVVRHLEAGVGWVGRKGDVRPAIDTERYFAALVEAETHSISIDEAIDRILSGEASAS